jgi:hypothetical protein
VKVAQQVVLLIFVESQLAVNFLQNAVRELSIGEGGEILGMDVSRDRPQ